ncbi:response regulator transcription factor [Solibacillus silvestris]|uniref:response regulator transcription factor n=1 Tax=Solibacillus silvestris TaxID=76853 RepID=UPI003F7FB12F
MASDQFPYLLFLKMYRSDLQKEATTYIESIPDLTINEKRQFHLIAISFIQFLASQMKQQQVHVEALQYWVRMHQHSLPVEKASHFPKAIEHVLRTVLKTIGHSNTEQILHTHETIMEQSMHSFMHLLEQPLAAIELSTPSFKQLDAFSMELIQLNGTEDLPLVLVKAEEIFQFKRCVFYSYNPWLNEFSGVIGLELPKIQRMQGNIDIEPVFALKKPVFLKEPAPYVQQVAIDLFNLSSVIFIPIEFEQQLYGWISFDQIGEPFDCDNEKLYLLEQAGHRLGMYLARKQLRNHLNHRLQMSEKEFTILYLLAEGYKNKEIAEVLFLSEFTVRDYVQKLMEKLQAKNRTQIISTAFRMGLVE